MKFEAPHWVLPLDELSSWDFNREIVNPGTNETFPLGAIGVRVDYDFWAVAALPYEEYINKTIQEIVAEFWPDCPDPEFDEDRTT